MTNENIVEDMSKYVYTFANKDENGKNYKLVLEPQSHEKEMELVKKYGTILEMLPVE